MNEPLYTPEEFAKEMQRIADNFDDDSETRHWSMDDTMCYLLRSLGYNEGVDIFEETPRHYA